MSSSPEASCYEPARYTLTLVDPGAERLQVMMAIRAIWPEVTLRDARALVDAAPQLLGDNIAQRDLHDIRVRFRDAGAVIEIVNEMDGRVVR